MSDARGERESQSPVTFASALIRASTPVISRPLRRSLSCVSRVSPAGLHTIFAKVIGGAEVLDVMEKAKVDDKDRPLAEIRLKSITIHANPFAT